ncbi:uncharacterized protein LOC121738042 [Aricia agestis]|uniref:uncharacterized protein LOC121738042 n=1 Tax=Aricia agestis TaxID=91739 RepID=UPI001C202DB8|nr:uncharacterized protein LOC121738042 [Aricia agestis]XP_041985790.1 uncharacterized protein LOC121738042 [Aricia agestis]
MAKLIILLVLGIISTTLTTPVITRKDLYQLNDKTKQCSNLLHLNNAYYTLDEVKNIDGIPADMAVHWQTENIYFTLISDNMKMSLQVLHAGWDIEGIKVTGLGQSTCVDNLNDIVYIATDNGVYKLKDDIIEPYTATGEDVMYIALTHEGTVMYIATWPQNRVQRITNNGNIQESFQDIPNGHGLVADTRNNLYFTATKTSYILKSGQSVPVNIIGLSKDKVTGVYVSRLDEVYAMDESSNFFKIDPDNSRAKLLGSFNVTGVNTFAMDAFDNVIIGVKGKIMKFRTHEENPCIGLFK